MNKIKCLFVAILSITFNNNIISMEQESNKRKRDSEEKEERVIKPRIEEETISLLNLPIELLSEIIEEEKYREAIFNWNDIFEEPEINMNAMKGLIGSSKELRNLYIRFFNDLKKLKEDRSNYLKEQIKEQYKKLSTKDLNKALINILNKGYIYISEEDLKEAVRLIIAGADVNAKDNIFGHTALMYASIKDYKKIVQILIRSGANVNAKNNDGQTALILASMKYYYKEIVQMLIKADADVNAIDKLGNTALMYAAQKDHKEIVQMLLDKGTDVNAINKFGDTALMFASLKGRKEVVEILIKAGADVNAKDNTFGYTALMNASSKGHKEVVEILIDKGADVNAKNNDGKTALDLAFQEGHKDIVDIIKQKELEKTNL